MPRPLSSGLVRRLEATKTPTAEKLCVATPGRNHLLLDASQNRPYIAQKSWHLPNAASGSRLGFTVKYSRQWNKHTVPRRNYSCSQWKKQHQDEAQKHKYSYFCVYLQTLTTPQDKTNTWKGWKAAPHKIIYIVPSPHFDHFNKCTMKILRYIRYFSIFFF